MQVCGRLCYTFGTDSLDAFYSIVLKSKTPLRISKAEALHFTVAFAYVIVHSFVLYFQAVTLNVSFNSNNNALFTLIMSCQFSEIKGNVFKKMDRNSLYKATCSDIAERFQLGTFIIIIMTRDLIELLAYNALGGQSSCPSDGLHAGASEAQWWSGAHTHAVLHMIYGTMVITLAPLMTIGSELLIDWIKHAFMLRLNKIDTKVYESYVSDICRNIASPEKNDKDAIPESTPNDTSSNAESLHDREHPPNISAKAARIIEFVPLPLACLLVSTYTDTIKIAFDLFFNNSDGAYKKPVFETQDIDIADELLELNRGSTVASSLVSGSSCPANYGSPEQVPEYVTFFQQRFLKKLTFIIFIYVLLLFIKLYLNQKLMKKTRGYVKKGI